MNPSRLSLILAGTGWAMYPIIFVFLLLQNYFGPYDSVPRKILFNVTALSCFCIVPVIWIVGAILGASHALSFVRNHQKVPKSSIVGLSLSLIGLATTMLFVLLASLID